MARRRKRRPASSGGGQQANDLSYVGFVRDIIEIEPETGDLDRRVVAALVKVREALGRQQATKVARYLKLAEALDAAQMGNPQPTEILDRLSEYSPIFENLVGQMKLAGEAIAYGIGLPAITSLLIAPPRSVAFGDTVLLMGLFGVGGEPEKRCVVQMRWQLKHRDGFLDIELEGLDEREAAEEAIDQLLREAAYESKAGPLRQRARAVMIAGPSKVASLGNIIEAERSLRAVGAVREVAIELLLVTDPRKSGEIDKPLTERDFDIMFLWVDGQDQWAWNRARRFGERGGQAVRLDATDLAAVIDEVNLALRDIVGGPDGGALYEETGDLTSALSTSEQQEVRDALASISITLVFIGGNETQARHRETIEGDLQRSYGDGISIVWFTGWASNWNAIENAAVGCFGEAGALVVMNYVRTQLGQNLKRRAGEHGLPWVACTGSGRQSMQHSLERALILAARRLAM